MGHHNNAPSYTSLDARGNSDTLHIKISFVNVNGKDVIPVTTEAALKSTNKASEVFVLLSSGTTRGSVTNSIDDKPGVMAKVVAVFTINETNGVVNTALNSLLMSGEIALGHVISANDPANINTSKEDNHPANITNVTSIVAGKDVTDSDSNLPSVSAGNILNVESSSSAHIAGASATINSLSSSLPSNGKHLGTADTALKSLLSKSSITTREATVLI